MKNIVIMGAAGRDFHNFNVLYRDEGGVRVVAFTATQIPGIDGRTYPTGLAGRFYPDGVPIRPEAELEEIIREHGVREVVFAYSDVSHEQVMHQASRALAAGADFRLLSAASTMIRAEKPVFSVCAVRTGCGKSPVTAEVCRQIVDRGLTPVVIRHPMPYGDLEKQAVQRFKSMEDLDRHGCTVEEREEYEGHIERGLTVFAGVDYQRILDAAQAHADVVVWDGGNNDTPFIRPDIHIVVFDPLRAGHETRYHPGETNMLLADVAVLGKAGSAEPAQLEAVQRTVAERNPGAVQVTADFKLMVDDPDRVRGTRVLVVEDGPTLTHGGMAFGAARLAAERLGGSLAQPAGAAKGSVAQCLREHPHISGVLPAVGYSPDQLVDLKASIEAVECDLVLYATPINLDRLLKLDRPALRVRYEYEDVAEPTLEQAWTRLAEERSINGLLV
ncbi:MAG: cyclic 2,3-diphosphoglycerate synthase [Desulfovibrionaceae bacterium]